MKNWNEKDYDNAVKAIIRWFWEPLSDNCKREIHEHMRRMKVGYEIDKFISAVFGVKMCAMLIPGLKISESDLKNLDEIVNFIEKYEKQLMSFDPEDSVIFVGNNKDSDIESDYEELLSDIDEICGKADMPNSYDDIITLLQDYIKLGIYPEDNSINKRTIVIDDNWD